MYMLGGEVDTSRYNQEEPSVRTSLKLTEKDKEYLETHGNSMSQTARQVLKFLRENNLSPTDLQRCDA